MIMPGRLFTALTVPGGSVSGTTQVNGFTVPVDLALSSRTGNEPTQYVATRTIDLDEGFESADNDDVTAYLTDTSYAGTGNGGSGADGVAGASKYAYSFNGKRKDNEIQGEGNTYEYGAREYDPRGPRFWSVDPLTKQYPELSPYQFASNSPIKAIDIDGLEQWELSSPLSNLKREAEYRFIKLNSNQVHFPPPHPQPTISATNPTEIALARENTTRREVMNRMYNSDASFSIQIFNGVGAAANIVVPEASSTVHAIESFSDGNYKDGIDALCNLSFFKTLRVNQSGFSFTSTATATKGIVRLSNSDAVNKTFTDRGFYAPYEPMKTLGEITLPNDMNAVVRLSGPTNVRGDWFTTLNEVMGLSPIELKNRFSLKFEPTQITPATIKSGSIVRMGTAAAVKEFNATGGGFQIEILKGEVEYGQSQPLKK